MSKKLSFLFLILVTTLSATTLSVKSGWNLVGAKSKLNDISQLLQKIDIVFAYDSKIKKKGGWKASSLKYKNLDFTKVDEIKEGEGFWIYSNKAQELVFDDKNISNVELTYQNGWQILSPKKDILTLSDLNKSDIKIVWRYDSGKWFAFSPDKNISKKLKEYKIEPITQIKEGEGFWLLAKKDETPSSKYDYIPKDLTTAQAVRFLNKATFGSTPALVSELKQKGVIQWIDEQLSLKPDENNTYLRKTIYIAKQIEPSTFKNSIEEYLEDNDIVFNKDRASFHMVRYQNSAWFDIVTSKKDQLRHKLTYALSQIVVESLAEPIFTRRGEALSRYFDILYNNAFKTYKDLLIDISHSSSMSLYLTFNGNKKVHTEGTTTIYPDENYAREIMQLFSIGLYKLNIDGTLMLDHNGNTIPTYTQEDIMQIARVFTGWDLKRNPRYGVIGFTRGDLTHPTEFTKEYHDYGSKNILGKTIPEGLSGDKDIEALVDILNSHQNIAPFISKILIQRIAKSNPSPSYVKRVAEVFNDNGKGVKGDLKAVVKAILLDRELWSDIKEGKIVKFKEPLMAFTNFLRAFYASPYPKFKIKNKDFEVKNVFFINDVNNDIGQGPARAFSVFNFYDKDYIPNDNYFQENSLIAPELQIQTDSKIIGYRNYIRYALYWSEKRHPNGWGNLSRNRYLLDCSDEYDLIEKIIEGEVDHKIESFNGITRQEDIKDKDGYTKRDRALLSLIDSLDKKLTGGILPSEFKDILFNQFKKEFYDESLIKKEKPEAHILYKIIRPIIVAIVSSKYFMCE